MLQARSEPPLWIEQEPWLGCCAMLANVTPLGAGSDTVTFAAGSGPLFLTAKSYTIVAWPLEPRVTWAVPSFWIETSVFGAGGVGGVDGVDGVATVKHSDTAFVWLEPL